MGLNQVNLNTATSSYPAHYSTTGSTSSKDTTARLGNINLRTCSTLTGRSRKKPSPANVAPTLPRITRATEPFADGDAPLPDASPLPTLNSHVSYNLPRLKNTESIKEDELASKFTLQGHVRRGLSRVQCSALRD
ncbi:hypothetical protein E2C01_036392 [Portunus trituberculatus]|uniref:Uncharacterized protein n=1 Tax=Portunus trituberculatus TaxID=210409 RepID=A0A5B7F6L0_PORTR|nr:hypothetical protein [Portunus trituberculatus]